MGSRINHRSTPPVQAARILIRKHGLENANTRAGDRYDAAYDGEVKDFYCDVMHAIRRFQVAAAEAKKLGPEGEKAKVPGGIADKVIMVANKPSNGMEAEMAKSTTSNFDRDAAWGNDRLNVRSRAMEILRQHSGPSIMTMAEALIRARSELVVSEFEADLYREGLLSHS